MKKLLLTVAAIAVALTPIHAGVNTFTGYSEGTAWESYSAQMHKAGFYPATYHKQVSLTAAQIIAMYTTPVVLVAAPGSGKTIAVVKAIVRLTGTATQFTGGGATIIQYHSTANGAGTNACDSTIAGASIDAATGLVTFVRNGAVLSDTTNALSNKALYISNDTAVFAAGTGTAVVDIWYAVNP